MSQVGTSVAATASASDRNTTESFGWLRWAFAALLVLHAVLVLTNLRSGLLVGLEFRQAQTAISAFFIQAENNFSLAYPTPVLGKPWSIPMEFPLYQWCVVWLSNATGWSLTVSARLLSAASFYAVLPALYRLLGRLEVKPGHRLMALAVVLGSPLYIFYSRSFLIEAMALAFAAWFLVAFLETMARRDWRWLGLAVFCGSAAALVKVTTFMVWCLPAAIYGGWLLLRAWRSGRRDGTMGSTLAWGLACSLPVLAVAWWWVRVSDGIKVLNAAGADLVSSRLSAYNFGLWSDRFSPEIWGRLFGKWNAAVMPAGLAAIVLLLVGLFLRSHRQPVIWGLGLFFGAQLVFPQLYAMHDYYFYAAGVGLLVATGCGLAGLLDSKVPRPLTWLVWGVVIIGSLNAYRTGYYQEQRLVGPGGTGLSDAIRNTSPRDSVLIVMGDDWNSMLPYYSQRRALMVRRDLEHNASYLDRAFEDLRGEDIFALVVTGTQRDNHEFIAKARERFKLDPSVTLTHEGKTDVYVRRFHRNDMLRRLGTNEQPFYHGVVMRGEPDAPEGAPAVDGIDRLVTGEVGRVFFAGMEPKPVRFNFAFGLNRFEHEGRQVIGAHPVSTLWFKPPAGQRMITCEFGILPDAYRQPSGHTDGAEFTIVERQRDGLEKIIFQRVLDPYAQAGDRGTQEVKLSYQATDGGELFFRTGFAVGGSFDWCYWGRIKIE
jgi:hypothetical protein